MATHSVNAATRRKYSGVLEKFWAFTARCGWLVDNTEDLDKALAAYFDDAFLDGEGSDFGHQVKAAVEHCHINFMRDGRLHLPRVALSLKGWRKLAPTRSRLPMAEEHLFALAGCLLANREKEMALYLVTCFSAYLRPGEGRSLMAEDVVSPAAEGNEAMRCWVLVLAPWERQQATKTGMFDQTVFLDDIRMP